jgi:NRAMP (natural resistance-associated macrophage protein)-like metal ion transporter
VVTQYREDMERNDVLVTVPSVRGHAVSPVEPRRRTLLARFLSVLGPGLITGAADDDPAGIATYSAAGALLGTTQLWIALVTWPLMAAVQMTCARVAMATGKGLAGALRKKLPRSVVMAAAFALFIANTFNIAADLAGMADAAEMLSGINSHYFVVVFGIGLTAGPILFHYEPIAIPLKWLTLSLCAYIVTAFIVRPDWSAVVHATFVPSLPTTREGWAMLVGVLGATISPYLFFWQASQEVEEAKSAARKRAPTVAMRTRVLTRRFDVGVGTFFSNVGMYFIILTTALTLHRNGITHIQTSQAAAEALRPLAGNLAALLFTLGLIGVGFLAIPIMSASAAYAAAEIFGWRVGINKGFRTARAFYAIMILSTLVGIAIDFANINAIRALFWSAVVNGLLAPFLLVAILIVATDHKLMRNNAAPLVATVLVAVAACAMIGAALGMFLL